MSLEQITKTGVTGDYWNCYFPIAEVLCNKGKGATSEALRRYPIPRYSDRYSRDESENLFGREDLVERLDELADFVNQKFIDPEEYEEKEFKVVINEVNRIIFGRDEPYFSEVER